MEIFKALDVEQLLTATGFIVFLLVHIKNQNTRIVELEKSKDALTGEYIKAVKDNGDSLLESARAFDRLIQSMKS